MNRNQNIHKSKTLKKNNKQTTKKKKHDNLDGSSFIL